MKEDLVQIISDIVIKKILEEKGEMSQQLKIPVGISARHVHLSKEHLDILFGYGCELQKKKDLMGGQFACEEAVTIIGNKLNAIEKVRILGPVRSKTQVEVSKTDAIKLGISAPVRESGKIEESEKITIIGPKGAVTIQEGCIIAKRHIHMNCKDAVKFGVVDNQMVRVKIPGERGGCFDGVQIRVDESYSLEMHIDTDEANAMGIECGSYLEIEV